MSKYTMADIAREAGVAKSTVSRYFNHGYLKEETRQKIQDVVTRTGYEPSAAAQNLKRKHTKLIGIVVPTMTSTVTGRQLSAIDRTLRAAGYTALIINTDHDPNREIAAIEHLRSLKADGIILIATNISEAHQRLQSASSVPFLVMGQRFRDGCSVIYDDYQAGRDVGAYARAMGQRDVLYIGVSEFDEAVGRERKRGVLEGLGTSAVEVCTLETGFSYEKARQTVRAALLEHVPSLIICATDQMALAAYKEITDSGLRVPEDVSLIGFGGYEMSELVHPSITSVRFHNEQAGHVAASTLMSMIEKEPVAPLQIIGYTLRQGGSVKNLNQKERKQ